jgi:hypothetical protein
VRLVQAETSNGGRKARGLIGFSLGGDSAPVLKSWWSGASLVVGVSVLQENRRSWWAVAMVGRCAAPSL